MNFDYINPTELSQGNASGLEPHEIPEAARQMGTGLKTVLDLMLEAAKAAPPASVATPEPDWISATEAAAKYPVTRRWIIANRRKYPFINVKGHKNTIVSQRGIERWLDKR